LPYVGSEKMWRAIEQPHRFGNVLSEITVGGEQAIWRVISGHTDNSMGA